MRQWIKICCLGCRWLIKSQAATCGSCGGPAACDGRFEHSKSATDLWAQSDAGRSYESWILSTFSTAISVDMIARRVFVLTSIESFSAKDEGDLEAPPEPLADLYLFIRGVKVHDKPLLLRT